MSGTVTITKAMMRRMLGACTARQMAAVEARLPVWARYGPLAGITQDARAGIMYLAQVAHESDRFRTAREYGIAAYFARYNGRADLGNGPKDGPIYPGRGDIQTTGRDNYRKARERIVKLLGDAAEADIPDFERDPGRLEVMPWAAISGLAWWRAHNLSAKSTTPGDMVPAVTRVINGGVNGLSDRCDLYAGLFCAVERLTIRQFQERERLAVDGVAGPKTRAAMAAALAGRELKFGDDEAAAAPPAPMARPADLVVAPVTAGYEDRLAAVEAEVAALRQALSELVSTLIARG